MWVGIAKKKKQNINGYSVHVQQKRKNSSILYYIAATLLSVSDPSGSIGVQSEIGEERKERKGKTLTNERRVPSHLNQPQLGAGSDER